MKLMTTAFASVDEVGEAISPPDGLNGSVQCCLPARSTVGLTASGIDGGETSVLRRCSFESTA